MPKGLPFIGARYDVIYRFSAPKVAGRKPGDGKNEYGEGRTGFIIGPLTWATPAHGMKKQTLDLNPTNLCRLPS